MKQIKGFPFASGSRKGKSAEILVCRDALAHTPHVRDLYDQMLPQLRKDQRDITLVDDASVDDVELVQDVNLALKGVLHDYPELFWYDGGAAVYRAGRGTDTRIVVKPNSTYSPAEVKRVRQRLGSAVSSVTNTFVRGTSDAQLVEQAYLWLARNVTYDLTAEHGQTPVGCLLDRSCVCAGIAGGMTLMLRKLGIPCASVSVRSHDDGLHRLNLVKADGRFTFVDATGAQLSFNEEVTRPHPHLTYRYLGFGSAELERLYEVRSGQRVPRCKSTGGWYASQGLFAQYFTEPWFDAILCNTLLAGLHAVEVKFATRRDWLKAKAYVESSRIFSGRFGDLLLHVEPAQNELHRSDDESFRTLMLWWQSGR